MTASVAALACRLLLARPDLPAALRLGAQAGIGLPLRAWGEIFGALTIYSTKANDFNTEEVALLTRFADDISYGVSSLRARVAANAGLAVN